MLRSMANLIQTMAGLAEVVLERAGISANAN